eukprot:TRINITY_DN2209_c0_g1_i1.p1 TRINITY_DN2209_c0_g1~~TRINITY_DN2209_c0_g1_i1.p1  ORF type:complete len:231 (+),score=73.73 TRINITY_DN2209_c0_g1_i1:99-695(+)
MAAVGGAPAGRRFNFSPRVVPFQPSPSLTASDASFGTGTAATTPCTVAADVACAVSPGASTPQRTPSLNPAARPWVPKELRLPQRTEDHLKGRKQGVDVSTLLALRGQAAEVDLCDSLPFVVVTGRSGTGWAEKAALALEKEAGERKAKAQEARTTLAFLRASDSPPKEQPMQHAAPEVGDFEGFSVGPSRSSAQAHG